MTTKYTVTLPNVHNLEEWLKQQNSEVQNRVRYNTAYRGESNAAILSWLLLTSEKETNQFVIHTPHKDVYGNPGEEVTFEV